MYSRISSAAPLLVLAACAPEAGDRVASAAPADRIECATGGAPRFRAACVVEREPGSLIVHHEDGGFRRFLLDAELALSPADGAADLQGRALADGRFELRIDGDRYRLPPR